MISGAGAEEGSEVSGGDVHDIIGPLVRMEFPEKLRFTRMTGDLLKAMRHCPQPIVAAVDGVCAGAGAILAMGADRVVRLKPQNLVAGLPVKHLEAAS